MQVAVLVEFAEISRVEYAVFKHLASGLFVFVVSFHHAGWGGYENLAVICNGYGVVGADRHGKRIVTAAYGNAAGSFRKPVAKTHFYAFCLCGGKHLFARRTCAHQNDTQFVVERIGCNQEFQHGRHNGHDGRFEVFAVKRNVSQPPCQRDLRALRHGPKHRAYKSEHVGERKKAQEIVALIAGEFLLSVPRA